jgi:hypothetical protein
MDDLKMLGTLLAKPDRPAPRSTAAGASLQETIRRPVRRHRATSLGAGSRIAFGSSAGQQPEGEQAGHVWCPSEPVTPRL